MTIPDVVFVIDTGKTKENKYGLINSYIFKLEWIAVLVQSLKKVVQSSTA